jgi:uncharacterized phiE125 gp8 family phage protein
MIEKDPLDLPPEALAAVKSWLRVERSDEDALIESALRAAVELGEALTGQAMLVRAHRETLRGTRAWQRLAAAPMRTITEVEGVEGPAPPAPLDPEAYALDVDSNGEGWIRLRGAGSRRLRITYEAGLTGEWSALPAPLRQGAVRLAAHLYTHRTEDERNEPPAAVTALWRPFRRLRLA